MPEIGRLDIIRVEDPAEEVGWYLLIEHADPVILISQEHMAAIQQFPEDNPWMRLDGNVLTINGRHSRVVYEIGLLQPASGCFLAQWPADQPLRQS